MVRSKSLFTALLALSALGAPLLAQAPGDYVLSDIANNRIYSTTPGQPLNRIFTPRVDHTVDDVIMDRDNRSLLVLEVGQSSTVASGLTRFSPTTVVANYGQLNIPTDLEIDGNGRYLASYYGLNLGVLAVNGGVVTTIVTGVSRYPIALTEDVDTGGLAVLSALGVLERVSRSGAIATIASAFPIRATDVEHDCRTGDFIVSTYTPPHVRRIDRNTGATTNSWNFQSGVAGINLRDSSKRIDVCGWADYQTRELDGTAVSPLASHAGSNFVAITRYGQRQVSGRGVGTPGSDYFVDLSFPTCAGKAYVTGFSFAIRPGIPVGTTHEICLNPDAMFLNALRGAFDGTILFNRVGTLDANGEGSTRMRIPPTAPIGLRVFTTAVVICPSAPNGLEIADTIGVTVR